MQSFNTLFAVGYLLRYVTICCVALRYDTLSGSSKIDSDGVK